MSSKVYNILRRYLIFITFDIQHFALLQHFAWLQWYIDLSVPRVTRIE